MTILSPTSNDAAAAGRQRAAPDVVLIVAMLALVALGVLMVYSASRDVLAAQGIDEASLMRRQAVFAVIGVLAFFGISLVDYRELQPLGLVVYGGTLLMLVMVLFQPARNNATRWIILPGGVQLQPSEFAKVAVILVLAAFLAREGHESMTWKHLVQALAVLAIPAALVVRQPDLGTSLVFGFLAIVILYAAGASYRQLALLAIMGAIGVMVIFQAGLLEDYQEERLTSFLSLGDDQLDADYNQLNSVTTIGSGQFFGKGLNNGALTRRAFVPEQETDFIFTAVGEQLGFVGGSLVLTAYALIVLRLLRIAAAARDRFGQLLAVGVAALFVFHVFVNIGMTIGIMPVTGLPLPFMSAGGSSMLAMALALGIAHSVWLKRSKIPVPRTPVI